MSFVVYVQNVLQCSHNDYDCCSLCTDTFYSVGLNDYGCCYLCTDTFYSIAITIMTIVIIYRQTPKLYSVAIMIMTFVAVYVHARFTV